MIVLQMPNVLVRNVLSYLDGYCVTYVLSLGRLIILQEMVKLYEKITGQTLHIMWGDALIENERSWYRGK